jgi:hypothetical protein
VGTHTKELTILKLEDILDELEYATAELGRDVPLDGHLLDLAVLAMAIAQPKLWRNQGE